MDWMDGLHFLVWADIFLCKIVLLNFVHRLNLKL
jgi:hypothetical protein